MVNIAFSPHASQLIDPASIRLNQAIIIIHITLNTAFDTRINFTNRYRQNVAHRFVYEKKPAP